MSNFNDIDLKNWKKSEVWTDSLWIIKKREKGGKHSNFYHGNFVPQIPYQLILRYSKENDLVLDPFLGSGTTAYECETLKRNFVGVEIQNELVEKIQNNLDKTNKISKIFCGDSSEKETFQEINTFLKNKKQNKVQLAILHPPYADIVKFSNLDNDLSNKKSLKEFLKSFNLVLQNTKHIMKKDGYLAIVIGDKYSSGQWIPLGFYCMNEAQKIGMTLKSVVVKNMEGNRAKMNKEGIWRYRALTSDYYIFKHEYIFIFKNKL
jgi:DNA modification methylase